MIEHKLTFRILLCNHKITEYFIKKNYNDKIIGTVHNRIAVILR